MKMQTLALAFLAAAAIGGIAWVFIYPYLSGEKKAEHRRASVAKTEPAARQVDKSQRSRREQVEGSLKDVEARRRKEKKVPLGSRLLRLLLQVVFAVANDREPDQAQALSVRQGWRQEWGRVELPEARPETGERMVAESSGHGDS